MPKKTETAELCHCGKAMKHVGAHRGSVPANKRAATPTTKTSSGGAAPAPAAPAPKDEAIAMLERLLAEVDKRRTDLQADLRNAETELAEVEPRRNRLLAALEALSVGRASTPRPVRAPKAAPAADAAPEVATSPVTRRSSAQAVLAAVAAGDRPVLPDVTEAVQKDGWEDATPQKVRLVLKQLVAQGKLAGDETRGFTAVQA